jgi:hypothetical protein
MIQIIVNAFVEEGKETAVVEVLFASADHEKVKAEYQELKIQYPDNYLAICDLPLDTELSSLPYYPSVAIGK